MIKFLANGLLQIRKEKNLSYQELAIASKIDKKVLEKIESGQIILTSNNIINICKALDISYDQLLFNEHRKPLTIDLRKISEKNLCTLLSLQSEFKSLNLKNIESYVLNLYKKMYSNHTPDFSFAEKCVNIRTNLLGLSQEGFSKLLNVSRTSVYKWETGSRPAFSILFNIALECGFTIDYLYNDGYKLEISPYGLDDEGYAILLNLFDYFVLKK